MLLNSISTEGLGAMWNSQIKPWNVLNRTEKQPGSSLQKKPGNSSKEEVAIKIIGIADRWLTLGIRYIWRLAR
jgi:hypothetical protein